MAIDLTNYPLAVLLEPACYLSDTGYDDPMSEAVIKQYDR